MNMRCLICFALLSSLLFTLTHAATFEIRSQCPYPVWAAALPGGGKLLNTGQSWMLNVAPGTAGARIWGRTNCNFGGGGCQTGDCGGLLQCQGSGVPPTTLAEFSLNQPNNLDYVDISLVDGFNIPMSFTPVSGNCMNLRCTADINGQCPAQLRAPRGGCLNPCNVYKTNEYCCTTGPCGPTPLSMFFKGRCPDAYSYPKDDTSLKTCPGGTNYRVVFCP